jgi:D-alanine-D-alanine ligase
MNNTKIAVINGGHSAEATVSRSSAKGVIEALRENYDSVTSIELDSRIAASLADCSPDVVFPILHGPPGEDGTLQGFLEVLEYSYVGSDVHSSAFAMDKIVAKEVFRRVGLPVARQCIVSKADSIANAVDRITSELGESVVVKPACQGSAIGVALIDNANQLEERILGKEITVGVIDTDTGTDAFPVIEITTPENSWYDFDHRYTPGLSEHLMPADLPEEQLIALQQIAVAAHQSLGCRDLSRADFIVTDSDIYLLEVNTLPGMTPTSLYPDGARGYGLEFPDLVKYLAERAVKR